jgi:regulatory protein
VTGQSKRAATALEKAKALVLRVLAFHARSEAQLRARLAKGGFEAEVDEAIAWARRLGYLDDAAYARGRARWLLGPGGVGPRRALERLRAAGIEPAAAHAAVAEATEARAGPRGEGESAEAALARAALARKLRGRVVGELDDRERARVARFLLGRGFSPAAVGRLVPVRGGGD